MIDKVIPQTAYADPIYNIGSGSLNDPKFRKKFFKPDPYNSINNSLEYIEDSENGESVRPEFMPSGKFISMWNIEFHELHLLINTQLLIKKDANIRNP